MSGQPAYDYDRLLSGLEMPVRRDAPLGPLTWYGVGGGADVLAHPTSVAQLAELSARCAAEHVPFYVLGSGANLLVRDAGVRGVVVRLDAPCFTKVTINGSRVGAGAGADLFKLVLETARAGLSGLETVAGIPASVGGAVRMNAGGAYGDIGSAVSCVEVMSTLGEVYSRGRDDLVFGYRRTNILAPVILGVTLDLEPQDPEAVMKRVKEVFVYKKNSQPMGERSAGCAFKNPDRTVGLSAGQLIDRAGLKGLVRGGARVSEVHANFVVAEPGGRAADVEAVLSHMQRVVADRFGVSLEREVVIWPRD